MLQRDFKEIKAQLGTGEIALNESPFVEALKCASNCLVVRNWKSDVYERIGCICEIMRTKQFEHISHKTMDNFADRFTSFIDANLFDPNNKKKIMT